MYQKVYFYIDSLYEWGKGFPSRSARIAFHEEAKRLFRRAGWEIVPGSNSAESDTAVKDKQALYLHPMEFSGVILAEEIPAIRNMLAAARNFQLRNIGRFGTYQDLSDEDYIAYLDSRKTEIIDDILRHYKTRRRDLFYTCDMSESIGREYRIPRVGHEDQYGDSAFHYVRQLIDELIADGRLRTGNTKYGQGIRTALQSELKYGINHNARRAGA